MADMTESFETDEYASLLKDFGLRRRSSSLSSSSTDIILHLDEDSDEEIVEDENETFNMVPKDATCSFVKLKKQTSKPEPDEIKAAGEDVHEKVRYIFDWLTLYTGHLFTEIIFSIGNPEIQETI